MGNQFIITEEQRLIFIKETSINSDFPRLTHKLHVHRDGYLLTLDGNRNELEIIIERLESIGVL